MPSTASSLHPAPLTSREGKPVSLPLREFKLLCYFVEHAGIPLARDELLREVWGYEGGTSTRTVDVHVTGLRRKLEKNPKRPELILTVVGVGYQFGRGMRTDQRGETPKLVRRCWQKGRRNSPSSNIS